MDISIREKNKKNWKEINELKNKITAMKSTLKGLKDIWAGRRKNQ